MHQKTLSHAYTPIAQNFSVLQGGGSGLCEEESNSIGSLISGNVLISPKVKIEGHKHNKSEHPTPSHKDSNSSHTRF